MKVFHIFSKLLIYCLVCVYKKQQRYDSYTIDVSYRMITHIVNMIFCFFVIFDMRRLYQTEEIRYEC